MQGGKGRLNLSLMNLWPKEGHFRRGRKGSLVDQLQKVGRRTLGAVAKGGLGGGEKGLQKSEGRCSATLKRSRGKEKGFQVDNIGATLPEKRGFAK